MLLKSRNFSHIVYKTSRTAIHSADVVIVNGKQLLKFVTYVYSFSVKVDPLSKR